MRLEKGDYFGEVSFFTDMQFSATAKSVHFSGLIFVNRDDFMKLARRRPKDLVRGILFVYLRKHFVKSKITLFSTVIINRFL
jgi:CRP-like cAMP-binding protein